jgi:hypothetical protein
MPKQGRAFALAALVAALVLAAAGCGGGDESSGGDTAVAAAEPTTAEENAEDASVESTQASGIADEDCTDLASIGFTFDEALRASVQDPDLDATTKFFDTFIEKAPDDIKDDLRTVATAFAEVVPELKDLNFEGESPETTAKLLELSARFETPKLRRAAENVHAWAEEHCGATTP